MTAFDQTTQNVVALHALSEAEALDWLRAQPGGRVTASHAELGRCWGWNRKRAGRRLKAWATAGHIKRRGDTVTVLGTEARTSPGPTTGTKGETRTGTNRGTKTGTNCAPDPVTSRKLTRLQP